MCDAAVRQSKVAKGKKAYDKELVDNSKELR